MVEARRVVEGEMFGAPVPNRWPGSRESTELAPDDEGESEERLGFLRRLARAVRRKG